MTAQTGNADCHTKNLGYLYTSIKDVRVAPIYDMLSIRVYDTYASNPPGMFIDGRKTWTPGNALWRVLQQHLGIEPAQQRELCNKVADAVSSVMPELMHRVNHIPGFRNVGTRMIWEWNAGLRRLDQRLTIVVPDFTAGAMAAGIKTPTPAAPFVPTRIGESPLMAPRRRKKAPTL